MFPAISAWFPLSYLRCWNLDSTWNCLMAIHLFDPNSQMETSLTDCNNPATQTTKGKQGWPSSNLVDPFRLLSLRSQFLSMTLILQDFDGSVLKRTQLVEDSDIFICFLGRTINRYSIWFFPFISFHFYLFRQGSPVSPWELLFRGPWQKHPQTGR